MAPLRLIAAVAPAPPPPPPPRPRRAPPSAARLASGGVAFAAAAAAVAAASPPALAALVSEPANALSLPTWAVHVSSVAEWVTAMALVWDYGERTGLKGWKGLSWGMVPLLGGAMCACTWHFFYNSESLEVLVALQGALTEWSSIGMKPPLCLDMDRMSGCRERDVSCIGTLWDGIGRSSLLAPRQDKQQQQQRKQPAHASMALRRKRLRLRRRRETMRRSDGMEMEMVNLKLYLENRCILEENERLREKASALRRENLALRADLRTTSPATVVVLMPAAAASSC
uniref:Uncharacterized protein n=1 Tax=Oryza punctata TaxID=4537 RepID=A0A0E0M3I5_ORYPU